MTQIAALVMDYLDVDAIISITKSTVCVYLLVLKMRKNCRGTKNWESGTTSCGRLELA